MQRFRIISLIFTVLFAVSLFGQDYTSQADSLIRLIRNNPQDTALIREFASATTDIPVSLTDTAYYYASELYRVSDFANYRYGLAVALNYQGWVLEQEDYRRSIEKYNQSLGISEKEGFKKLQSSTLNNLSIVYSVMGEFNKSIEYLLQFLKLAEEMDDDMRKAVALNNIGLRYHDMGNPEIALDYYDRAKRINLKTGATGRYATNLSNMGNSYQVMWQNNPDNEQLYDSALSLQMEAIRLNRINQDYYKMQYGFQSLAILYAKKKQLNDAQVALDSAVFFANKVEDHYGNINLMRLRADLLNKEKRFGESIPILQEALKMATEMNYRTLLVDIYDELSESYSGKKDFVKAYEFDQKYMELQDSLQNIEKSKAFAQMNFYEQEKARQEKEILNKNLEIQELRMNRQRLVRNSVIIVGSLIFLLLIGLWQRYRFVRRTKSELEDKNKIIQNEREKSDKLLLNILPEETAGELKASGKSKAKMFDMVTVMFADFKGFTMMAEKMTPQELVDEIDHYYKTFDDIITRHNIEKIKTIGDAYMCAGGLPTPNKTNPVDVLMAACEIREFMKKHKAEKEAAGKPFFEARIGIHTGPVVAGIVGNRKFAYDIWGDTVNIASRMESSGEVGKINISQVTWESAKDKFECTYRGKLETKNKGLMDMYFVECKKDGH
jgi:class 3 adenylate cyclase